MISNQSKANSTAGDPNFNVNSENATSPFQNIDSAEHEMIDSSFECVFAFVGFSLAGFIFATKRQVFL